MGRYLDIPYTSSMQYVPKCHSDYREWGSINMKLTHRSRETAACALRNIVTLRDTASRLIRYHVGTLLLRWRLLLADDKSYLPIAAGESLKCIYEAQGTVAILYLGMPDLTFLDAERNLF